MNGVEPPLGRADPSVMLVSGGTHGIGAACVERLTAGGHVVVFTGRDESAAADVCRKAPGALFVRADAQSSRDLRRAAAAALRVGGGRLAGLVNNAGMTRRSAFMATSARDWDQIMTTNARSAYLLTLYALEGLRRQRGAVVNVSSVAGRNGEEGLALYSASKGALLALTQSLALEFGSEVRFNAICPGQIGTRMMAAVMEDAVKYEGVIRRIPAGRLGTPDEVAALIAWLLSAEAAFVNGAIVTIDGGETAGFRAQGNGSVR